MTRNTLLVAVILVALALGGILWFVLTPDAPEELAQAGARPASQTVGAGEATTKQPTSGTQTQDGQPGQPGSNVGGAEATRTAEAEGTTAPGSEMASAAPPAAQAEAEVAAEPEAADAAAAAPAAPLAPPSFDIVRVEQDGSTVVAGRAPAGSLVQLYDGDRLLAEAEAGTDGSFVMLLEEPLTAGTRRLSLAATSRDGTVVPSEDEVVVVVAGVTAPAAGSEAMTAAEQSAAAAVAAVDAAAEPPATETAASQEPSAPAEPAAPAAAAAAEESASAPSETAPAETTTAAEATAAEATTEAAAVEAAADAAEPSASAAAAATEEVEMADTPSLADALETQQDVASASTAGEPAPQVAGADASQPLVVVQPKSGEGASQVLQAPTGTGGKPAVSIEAVDYDLTGQVVISGQAPAGAEVLLYLDHGVLGQARADGEGRWQLRPDGNVAAGLHRLRADLVDAAGTVLARAEIPFQRAEPIQVPADEEFVVVQPGNSLWVIARKSYGRGIQYTAIYDANAGQIRNPHLIYPGQIFLVPTVN